MFYLKYEKTLRIFSSILESCKERKHLHDPFFFLEKSKKRLEMLTMICYNVSAFIKRYHSMTARRSSVEEREA